MVMEKQQGKSRLTRASIRGDTVPTRKEQTKPEDAPTQPVPPKPAPIFRQPAVVKVRSLHVRRDHSMNSDTVTALRSGERVSVLETWTDGRDTWARIGNGQWAVMIFNGQTYIELI